MSGPFNGHKNWNYWNVSLWLNNDEPLYGRMMHYMRHTGRGYRFPTKRIAARFFLEELKGNGLSKTPDGAPYSVGAIAAAMQS